MPRPPRCRRICGAPRVDTFCPNGCENTEPILLTLDEYEVIRLVDLDKPTVAMRLVSMVFPLQDELGMTMVLITHDVNEAVLLSDKTVFLEEGKVKQEVNIALPKPRRFGDQNLLPFQQTLFNFFLT